MCVGLAHRQEIEREFVHTILDAVVGCNAEHPTVVAHAHVRRINVEPDVPAHIVFDTIKAQLRARLLRASSHRAAHVHAEATRDAIVARSGRPYHLGVGAPAVFLLHNVRAFQGRI